MLLLVLLSLHAEEHDYIKSWKWDGKIIFEKDARLSVNLKEINFVKSFMFNYSVILSTFLRYAGDF